ncbi:bifunctional 5,10-methylene-tetrahydrofolate dehydrogenase/5,10-methylene-tetrahydrofolate cyclohydrolase [Alicyclobacillaceae bacterium I2511]|nr:bifunctional 5,10-methylene-tetrahydrofolate dehydrogenase/5,10-methylene-tetrahydrofolate cyclohydrolase [Alicyclobacillaceae bacterium I2511]
MTEPLMLLGKPVVDAIEQNVRQRALVLANQNITPQLATILVGEDPASTTYVRMKGNACKRNGLTSKRIHLPESTTTIQLLAIIQELNEDPSIHGILLQHPVPRHIDEGTAFDAILPQKDVDGVSSAGFGLLALGHPGYGACTPQGILHLLDYYHISLSGLHAVVLGRSAILGKPMAAMLLNRDATVTVCHSHSRDVPSLVATADLLVAAVGKPRYVQGSWIKPGAVVIDAGYNPGNVGDVDFSACLEQASAITPVPGGVGPVTIATLLDHTVRAAEMSISQA